MIYALDMKIFLLLGILLSFTSQAASTQSGVRIIAKINKIDRSNIEMSAQDQTVTQAIRYADPRLEKVLDGLDQGAEVLLTGKVEQFTERRGDGLQFKSIFIIEEIRPISLASLGKMENQQITESPVHLKLNKTTMGPHGINASPQVVAAITITASLLMLKSLAPSEGPGSRDQLNNGMIFSAGALATGLFVWDQIRGKEAKN